MFFALVLGAIALGALVTPLVLQATNLNTTIVSLGVGVPILALFSLPWLQKMDHAAVAKVAELAPKVRLLEALEIFASAPRAALERLAAAAVPLTVNAGEAIVRQGEPADALYVVTSGEVSVSSHPDGGSEEFIRTMGPRSYFGEIGLLAKIPRTATVVAREETGLWKISGEDFLSALTTLRASRSLIEGATSRLARTSGDDAARAAIEQTPS